MRDLPGTTSESRSRPIAFLVPIPALAALAALAAFAPGRVKLLVLFPAVVGAAAGAAVVHFASRNGVASRRALVAAAAVLVPLTLAGYGTGSFLVWRQARAEAIAANLLSQPGGRLVLDQVRSGKPPASEAEAEMIAAYRDRMNPPLSVYLTERLKGLPVAVPMPWAAAVAAGELLLGWVAGVATAVIMTRDGAARREAARRSSERN